MQKPQPNLEEKINSSILRDYFLRTDPSIVRTPPYPTPPRPLSAGGGGLNLQLNFQKGCLIGPQLLEGIAGKEGMPFFRGGREDCNFHIKNKLKSEIFNDKKSLLAKIVFSVIRIQTGTF